MYQKPLPQKRSREKANAASEEIVRTRMTVGTVMTRLFRKKRGSGFSCQT
jgi:hypothetical protein